MDGVCEGRLGWVHDNCNKFSDKSWIIVERGCDKNGKMCPEKAHLIDKDNICFELTEGEPTCMEEALLKEHKDIKKAMKTLAKKLAEFDELEPSVRMMEIFMDMWSSQKRKRAGKTRVSGSRFVRNWNPDDPINIVDEEDFEYNG